MNVRSVHLFSPPLFYYCLLKVKNPPKTTSYINLEVVTMGKPAINNTEVSLSSLRGEIVSVVITLNLNHLPAEKLLCLDILANKTKAFLTD